MNYWGFDLGDGESTVVEADDNWNSPPRVVPIGSKNVILTAWTLMKDGRMYIGEEAARRASSALRSAVRFKSRFLDPGSDSAGMIRDFSFKLLETLRVSGDLTDGDQSNRFYIGCPAGWDQTTRDKYRNIFSIAGCPSPTVVSESRAVMVGAMQSNSVAAHVDLREKTVLVVDIGSSTTDFAYIDKGVEKEVLTAGEVYLGGGIMDELLLETCVSRSNESAAIRQVFAESEAWKVECELMARELKEKYFSSKDDDDKHIPQANTVNIMYDGQILFDMKIDAQTAELLYSTPRETLGGRTFKEAFISALKEVSAGTSVPELLFLTGGVSRMSEIRDWCKSVFPDALIYCDPEPEFSVAKGLAWCSRIDAEMKAFRDDVDKLIASDTVETIVTKHLKELYQSTVSVLTDPMVDIAVKPVLDEWRENDSLTLADVEKKVQEAVNQYMCSKDAKARMYQPTYEWISSLSSELAPHTSDICQAHHIPANSLNISSEFSASDIEAFGRISAGDSIVGGIVTGVTVLIDAIITAIVGMICGGAGTALIASGPLGIIVGAVISVAVLTVGAVIGRDEVMKRVKSIQFPRAVKNLVVSDSRIKGIKQKIRKDLEHSIYDPKNTDMNGLNEKMCRKISDSIEAYLKEISERTEIRL